MKLFKCSRITLLPVICFLSILTYGEILPSAIKNSIVYVIWIIAFGEAMITCAKRFSVVVGRYIIYGIGIFIGAIILEISNSRTYLTSATLYSIALALGIMVIGAMFGTKLNEDDVTIVLRWYVLGACVLGVYLFVTNIATGFNLNSRTYININKNSVGQILSSATCILILSFSKLDSKKISIAKGIVALFLIIIVFLIRSRTSLLCFAISLFIILTSRHTNDKAKRWIILTTFVALIIIALNNDVRETIVHSILLANRDATSLDAITSGRITIYRSFSELMRGKEFIGNGSKYYESFYLSNIVQFGYIVGIFVDCYAAMMIYEVKKLTKKVKYGQLLLIIAISYSLNGIFEGLPPYGPGTKNFLLWLLFGMASTHALNKPSKDGFYE